MCNQQIQHSSTLYRSKRVRRGLSLWPGLVFCALLALQGCNTLSNQGGHFRAVPGTGSGASALAINADSHFQGHIAFVRNHQLYVLSGKDGAVSALPTGTNVQDPAYSPDGSRLAYIRGSTAWSDLMVISARGGQPVALTHNQGAGQQVTCANGVSEDDQAWAANPIWTSDGSALYYLSDAQKLEKASCGFLDLAVWKIAARGGKAQLVLWPARGTDNTGLPGAGGDANLSLRPGHSDELAYTHYAFDPRQSGNRLVQVFLARLDPAQQPAANGQQEMALTPATSDDGKTQQQTLEASWSPDGQFLAYILRRNGATSLAIMPVSEPARGAPNFLDYANGVTFSPTTSASYSYPVWSPDGTSLLYLAFNGTEYNLYLVQLAINGTTISPQGSPIQLTQGGIDGDSRPSWTAA
jgi:Tol biopolymer transport system component